MNKVVEILKKNLFSVICGVVVVIALVALVWPIGGMYSDFEAVLKQRVDEDGKIKALATMSRVQPVVGGENATAEPLRQFPSKDVVEAGKKATAEVHTQADGVLRRALALNQQGRRPLVANVLPKPPAGQEGLADQFFKQYDAVMKPGGTPTPWVKTKPEDEDGPFNIPDVLLHSTPPVGASEVNNAKNKEWSDKYASKLIRMQVPPTAANPAGSEMIPNYAAILAEFNKNTVNFAEDFRRKRAGEHAVYMKPAVDPTAAVPGAAAAPGAAPFPVYPAGGTAMPGSEGPGALSLYVRANKGAVPTPDEVWFAQMGLWVQTDVARAVGEVNRDPKGQPTPIPQSPIKQLMNVDIAPGMGMYVTADDPSAAVTAGGASAAPAAPEGEIPRMYAKSPTGRVCNHLYDVVRFRVVLDLDADPQVLNKFVERLQYGRLITVLNVDLQRLDPQAVTEEGCDYGPRPCVRVTLDVESLFMRGWTVPLMPETVKTLLHVPAQPPAEGGAPAGTVALH